MKIFQVINKDLLTLAEIEKELFREDAFGVFLLFHYLEDHILFDKILNEQNAIIGFGIIADLQPTVLNPHELKYIEEIRNQVSMVAHLVDLAIRTKYWGNGYGHTLLTHFFQKLEEKNYQYIYLEVDTTNFRAIQFYQIHGFKEIGSIQSYYSTGHNAILMLKQLN